MRQTAANVVFLATSIAMTACSGQDPTPPTSTLHETAQSLPSILTPAPADAEPDEGIAPGRHNAATWDDASRAEAVTTAEEAMKAFARPDLNQDAWWAGIEPRLTPEAAQDYAYVLAANIPVHQVTGVGSLVDDASAYLARVQVPTDIGAYTLILTRANNDAPWLVTRFDPPEGVH